MVVLSSFVTCFFYVSNMIFENMRKEMSGRENQGNEELCNVEAFNNM